MLVGIQNFRNTSKGTSKDLTGMSFQDFSQEFLKNCSEELPLFLRKYSQKVPVETLVRYPGEKNRKNNPSIQYLVLCRIPKQLPRKSFWENFIKLFKFERSSGVILGTQLLKSLRKSIRQFLQKKYFRLLKKSSQGVLWKSFKEFIRTTY